MNFLIQRPFFLISFCSILILFSLPPFGVSIFYWAGLSLFLFSLTTKVNFSKKIIFTFFFIIHFISLSWIIQSFYSGGLGYFFLGIILILLLASFISFLNFSVINIVLKIFHNSQLKFFLLPLSLSIVELLKEFLMGGFPWNPSAIIYYKNLWVLKSLPFVGVYGLGVIIHLGIGLMLYSLIRLKKKLSLSISFLVLIIFLSGFFEKEPNVKNIENSLDILLIQPNIYESLTDFDVLDNFQKYEELTLLALSKTSNVDLIIWPEGSLPIDLNNRPGLLSRLGGILDKDQKLIVGSSAIENNQLFNRFFVIDHQGKINQHYDKQKLVLFGEYVPWVKPLLSRFLNLGMNYIPGDDQSLINLPKNIKAVPMICFESIFYYKHINKNICQSNLVLQISNDSWFGKWYGPQQHLANSLLRSVEFGKTLVRSTPSGISAIIDKKGNIIESISNDKKDFLYYNYPLNQSPPFCPSTLNIIMLLLFLIFGGSFLYVRIKK